MVKILLSLLICLITTFNFLIEPVAAKVITQNDPAILVCFSGGQEIARKTVVAGPFADEYKFAHEVKVIDSLGEHQLNFAGGLCIIDQGAATVKSKLNLSDRLTCYSGAKSVVNFEVYGAETTVDEYLEGRTFVAKSTGNNINSDSLHRYLIFGGGACLGSEIQ